MDNFLIQNSFPIFPIWHVITKKIIKLLAVIWVEEMRQLMEYYIVNTCNPRFKKIEVKNNCSAFCTTASPHGCHFSDKDFWPWDAILLDDRIPTIDALV